MTQDERNMLQDLADKIAKTPPPPKDQEAEEFIRTRIGNRPDALYLMTQTVLIQNLALQQAQQQIQQLQQRAGQPAQVGSGSFLGGAGQPAGGGYSQRGGAYYAGQQQYSAPPPQTQYVPQPTPGQPPSFLRGAAQTAAGVAAGALAFEGIQALFSHPGYGGGGLFGGGGGFAGAPVEETVVNNYYNNPADAGRDDYRDAGVQDAQYEDSGQYDDSGQYQDVSDVGDGGGFDDGGGGFDGGGDGGDSYV